MSNPSIPSGGVNAPAPRFNNSPDRKIGYEFTPMPSHLGGLLAEGTITPFDVTLLYLVLGYRRAGSSAWVAYSTIEATLHTSADTINRAAKRLKAAGLAEHRRTLSIPDIEDPSNRTGWRWHFLWMQAGSETAGKADASKLATPHRSGVPPRTTAAPQACDPAPGPRLQACDPANGPPSDPAPVRPNSRSLEVREESIDRANDSSSSTGGGGRGDAVAASVGGPGSDLIDQAVKIATEWKRPTFAQGITAEKKRITREFVSGEDQEILLAAVTAVCEAIPKKTEKYPKGIENPMGYLTKTIKDFRLNGIPSRVKDMKPIVLGPTGEPRKTITNISEGNAARAGLTAAEALQLTADEFNAKVKERDRQRGQILDSLGLGLDGKMPHPVTGKPFLAPQIAAFDMRIPESEVYELIAEKHGKTPEEIKSACDRIIAAERERNAKLAAELTARYARRTTPAPPRDTIPITAIEIDPFADLRTADALVEVAV